jgi:hemimethylated DNA binding protein
LAMKPTLYRALFREAQHFQRSFLKREMVFRSGVGFPDAELPEDETPFWELETKWVKCYADAKARGLEGNQATASILRLHFALKCPSVEEAKVEAGFASLRDLSYYRNLVEYFVKDDAFVPKERSDEVALCVGDIVQHKYFGRGVVYGWDQTCQAGEDWCRENQIDEVLKNGRTQPFYNLFLDDGTSRYCSQENVTLDLDPQPVSHPEVDLNMDLLFPGGFYDR